MNFVPRPLTRKDLQRRCKNRRARESDRPAVCRKFIFKKSVVKFGSEISRTTKKDCTEVMYMLIDSLSPQFPISITDACPCLDVSRSGLWLGGQKSITSSNRSSWDANKRWDSSDSHRIPEIRVPAHHKRTSPKGFSGKFQALS